MRYVAIDVETTGMSKQDDICEFAFAELDEDLNVVLSGGSIVNPKCPISPGAAGVHGITNNIAAGMPRLEDFFASTPHPFDNDDIIVIAHNAPFDVRFISKYMEIMGSVCTLRLARNIYPDSPDHKLQTLRHYLELEVDGDAHSASGDVAVLVALVRKMREDTGMDLDDMYTHATNLPPINKMPFGKHKGTPLKDLPPNYVTWLLSLPDLSDDLKISLQKCG
jgi:exodeoxyribonuclease X